MMLGCRGERGAIRIAAAASMIDVLPALLASIDPEAELRFGASSSLARQIREGAPADVLVSADPRWVDELVGAGAARAATRRTIATNRLVVIVPRDAPERAGDLRALAALPHLAVAGAEVPAGMHARTALARAGIDPGDRLVVAPDVRGALAWVARGEAEAGIVYATDARAEPRVRVAIELEPALHEPIRYEAIAITAEGEPIVEALGAPQAQRALAAAGFGPP